MNKKIIIIIASVIIIAVGVTVYISIKNNSSTSSTSTTGQTSQDQVSQDLQNDAINPEAILISGTVKNTDGTLANGKIIFGDSQFEVKDGQYEASILPNMYSIQFIDNSSNTLVLNPKTIQAYSTSNADFTVEY